FVGKAAGMNVALDGREIVQLKSPRFTRVDIPAGSHTLTASFGGGLATQTKPADFEFNAFPGDIVVVKVAMGFGATKNPIQIERVDLETVRNSLRGMDMVRAETASA